MRACRLSARTYNLYSVSAARRNFSFSKSSRTNAFTTRIAEMFSCTELFRSSYLVNTCAKSFTVRLMILYSAKPRISRAVRNIMLVLRFMKRHMNMLKIMVNGARTETRRIIWKAFCRLLTSVVMRVMSPDVENLSMLENENVCMFLYIASRRL